MISNGWKHIGGDVWETVRLPGPKAKRQYAKAIFQRFVSKNGNAVSLKFENTNSNNGEYKPGQAAGQLFSIHAVHRYFQHQPDYLDLLKELFQALDPSQLEELLEDEQKGVFERGEVILAAASRGVESFTPRKETGTHEARARIKAFLEQGKAIRLWFDVYARIIAEMKALGPIEFSKEMLSLDSRYRKTVLELRKITDILELCRSPGPFISWAPDRCWPSPVGLDSSGYSTIHFGSASRASGSQKDDPQIRYRLHSLQLVEKISKGENKRAAQDTLSKMITVNENGITVFKNAKGDELETSHLCHPARGGSKACYNPAHLVAETPFQNTARQRCLGTVWCDDRPYNVCPHGTDRCIGWLKSPIDTQLNPVQLSYKPSFVTRDKHAELFASSPAPAPAPAMHGGASGQPTNLSELLDGA